MTSLLIIPRPFLSSAARRAAFGLLVLASLGGCGASSASVKDNVAGGDMQTLFDQRMAAMQANLDKIAETVALQNDQSRTNVETSGDSVIDKRFATIEATLAATLKVMTSVSASVEAAFAKLEMKQSTGDKKLTATGEGASAQSTDQNGLLNIAIPTAGGGLAGVVWLGMYLKSRREENAAAAKEETQRQHDADAEETKRHQQIIDGMKCAFHGHTHTADTPSENKPSNS